MPVTSAIAIDATMPSPNAGQNDRPRSWMPIATPYMPKPKYSACPNDSSPT